MLFESTRYKSTFCNHYHMKASRILLVKASQLMSHRSQRKVIYYIRVCGNIGIDIYIFPLECRLTGSFLKFDNFEISVNILRNQKYMIGLDACSRQVFNYFDLYQSLNRLRIWHSQNCSMFLLTFVAGPLQGHWWGFTSRNYVVWHIFFLMNVSLLLKEHIFYFYLPLLQLVLRSVAAVNRLPVHQP